MNNEQNFSNGEVAGNNVTSQPTNQFNSINNGVTNNTPNNVNPTYAQNNIPNNTSNNVNPTYIQNNIPNNTPNNLNPTYSQNTTSSNKKSGKSKKIIFIILAILVLAGAGLFAYNKFGGSKSGKDEVDLNSIFDPNKPIQVKNKGKYGYIASDGKVMIEAKYNSATEFRDGYAVVKVDNPDTTAYNKEIYQIIDKKGNVQLSSESYSEPSYYSKYGIWVIDGILYDSKLNKVLADGITVDYASDGYLEFQNSATDEAGIMNHKGKIVFKWAGVSAHTDICSTDEETDELFASVVSYGDPEREVVVSLKTGDILFNLENPDDNYLSEEGDGVFFYYNQSIDDGYSNRTWLYFYNNKLAYQNSEHADEIEVYDFKNQILKIDYGYNYATNGKAQQYYYYDVKNKKMLTEKPEKSESSSNTDIDLDDIDLTELTYGYKEYNSSGKYGIMSGEKIIIPCEYDDIEYINVNLYNYLKTQGKEIVFLEKDKQTIVMNLKNQKGLGTLNSTYIYDYEESTFVKATVYEENGYTTKGYVIYNLLSGKSMTFDKDDKINIKSNYITHTKDGKTTYYNTKLEQIYVATE